MFFQQGGFRELDFLQDRSGIKTIPRDRKGKCHITFLRSWLKRWNILSYGSIILLVKADCLVLKGRFSLPPLHGTCIEEFSATIHSQYSHKLFTPSFVQNIQTLSQNSENSHPIMASGWDLIEL